MGWWGIGGDEIMGDHPADVVGEVLNKMASAAAKEGFHNVALSELTAAFTEVIERVPKLIEDLPPRRADVGEALAKAIRERIEENGLVPVERSRVDSYQLFNLMLDALKNISQSYLDTEIERRPRVREILSAFTFVLGYRPEQYLALIEPVVKSPLHHPLLSVPRKAGAALLDRCSTEAREALDLAGRIARLRFDVPLGPRPRGRAVIGPVDLLRALAVRGDLAPLASALALTPRFEADMAALRSLLGPTVAAPSSEEPPEIDPAWALSIGALLAARPGTLDTAALLGTLSEAALAELIDFDEHYVEGLLSGGEALGRLEARQIELAGWGAARPFFGVHLDRGGELDALTASLKQASVLVVVTEALPLVGSLAQAWAARSNALARLPLKPAPPDHLAEMGSFGRLLSWERPADTSGQVFTISESPDRRDLRSIFEMEPDDFKKRIQSPAAGDVILVAVTEGALEAASKMVPELEGLPKVELPPLKNGDLIAAWLCQRVRAELTLGETYSLLDLIAALEAADDSDRRTLDWERLRPWRDVPSRAARARLSASLGRALRRNRPLDREKDDLFFARYIQSEERLHFLAELDKTLP